MYQQQSFRNVSNVVRTFSSALSAMCVLKDIAMGLSFTFGVPSCQEYAI